ncbi:MAG TPA: lipid-A-disaccharide synthase [Bacteroidales bacterium]|jgi:lipid-A-disaccharide synthase|nr:lipid-A-disaccharide synthase [Bacteroidales bacterium]HNR42925.1 lipid-A-disaccharide synthase [Bacteroidales bacterium]HQG76320.1 lipid-A-disaccharide synthase [Bacteroidales bacterium]
MRYFIIAGEKSGDLHGANLVRELIKADPAAEVECWGGDLMEASGAKLLMHYKNTAYMGFVEVLKNLRGIRKNISLCKSQIISSGPDLLILIDYPGFNLRIAEWAKKSGFRVFYYISPKLWAWNEKRVKKVKKYVDRMYIIFPFEETFYDKHNIRAIYCGNPLLDETEVKLTSLPDKDKCKRSLGLDDRPVIALLAGSRKSEVKHILPKMLEVIPDFKDYRFIVAGVKNLPETLYSDVAGSLDLQVIRDRTYEILHISDAALVASGTATLETALFDVPQVVCFRGDLLSMLIAWMVIRVKYISLVNLIAGEEIVKELVQYSLNRRNLVRELSSILPGGPGRRKMLDGYNKVKKILGPSGASSRAAEDIVKTLSGFMRAGNDQSVD